jgi:hypothetical protein
MSSPALDLCMTQAAGLATHPAPSRRLTADPEATAVAELRQAAPGWADRTLIEAWIEVGRQRAGTAATLTHKACVLAE